MVFATHSVVIGPSFGKYSKQQNLRGIYIRSQIKQAHSHEFRVIGQLSNLCTATLIGRKHLLTAAHCVYNQKLQLWQENLDFTPAQVDEYSAPFGRYEWKKAYAPREFIRGSLDPVFDYAVVELEESIGEEIGWAGVRALSQKEDVSTIRLTGYPGDKKQGTLWTVNCPSTVEDHKITYQCDTFAGMSGSGIFSFDEESEEPGFIIGVHSYGGIASNGGPGIDEEIIKRIKLWMQGEIDDSSLENLNRDPFLSYKLYALNNCSETIDSYFSFFNAYSGMWSNVGEITLLPGLKSLIGRTLNTFYYFLGQSYQKTWRGESIILFNDMSLGMIEKRIELKDWGSWDVEFSCD